MTEKVKIAIVGSGPGGMSAGIRAAKQGASHVLLEKTDHLSDTIYKYQKGKLVMATPETLRLRSDADFGEGIREDILGTWDRQTEEAGVNVRLNAEVVKIEGQRPNFKVHIKGGEVIEAEAVILGMGTAGNANKLRCKGADLPHVQYQLDDPLMYDDEDIAIVGTGDSALENAIGLTQQNRVILINRGEGFPRAKAGNRTKVLAAIEKKEITEVANADSNAMVIENGRITIPTTNGDFSAKCDRVIARIGGKPPRAFLEACGIKFESSDDRAVPPLTEQYETNVPGLYVIGALAGYPLIKNCMNQGYDVVEYICGNDKLQSVDEMELEKKWKDTVPGFTSVPEMLAMFKERLPLFADLTMLQMREFMIYSDVVALKPGEPVFMRDDVGDSLFTIADGEVAIEINPADPSMVVKLGRGEFFGEVGLIAGRPRGATVRAATNCMLVEIPRSAAQKLIRSFPAAGKVVNDTVLYRQLLTILGQDLTRDDLSEVIETHTMETIPAGKVLIKEGEKDDRVFIIRSGSVTVSKNIAGREAVISYVPAGHYVGEMALFRGGPRTATVKAAIKTEAIILQGDAFRRLAEKKPRLRATIDKAILDRKLEVVERGDGGAHSSVVEFLVKQGLGEARDVLIIDESLCVGCDNCEKACAQTHGGVSRLNREAGPTYATVHVPTSCRHCEHPHCMADCPPDAIHRASNGEVYIEDTCIGCENCKNNCPYGVIQMSYTKVKRPGLLQWLLFGGGSGPDGLYPYWGGNSPMDRQAKGEGKKQAVKCDMCKDINGGAACVRACPTGAAMRVSPEEFLNLTRRAG